MATAKKKTTTARSPRKTPKTIRNLRGTLVHLRLFGDKNDKPYRIELQPRGYPGDVHTVPANLVNTDTFLAGVDVLFEVITKAEADKIQYGPTGFQPGPEAKLIRPEDTTILTTPDLGSDGKPRNLGPTYTDVQGSDVDLHRELRENAALPPNAFPSVVKVERAQ